ncbi:hypothetical protein CASFOL_012765 [Castilleja foliolosa]|uniref:Uncharacterized protein n=1 Tax=Castilleja foliolosa TaxID=1961234 RepID=A0ABD3DM43_9LAMI
MSEPNDVSMFLHCLSITAATAAATATTETMTVDVTMTDAQDSTETTTGTVEETMTEAETGTVEETITGAVPESITAVVPESITAVVPESFNGGVPESITAISEQIAKTITVAVSKTIAQTLTGAVSKSISETLSGAVSETPTGVSGTITPHLSPATSKRQTSYAIEEPLPKRATLLSPSSPSPTTATALHHSGPCPPKGIHLAGAMNLSPPQNSPVSTIPPIPTIPNPSFETTLPLPTKERSSFIKKLAKVWENEDKEYFNHKIQKECSENKMGNPSQKLSQILKDKSENEMKNPSQNINQVQKDESEKEMQNPLQNEQQTQQTEILSVDKDGNGLYVDVKCPCGARFALCYSGNGSYKLSYPGNSGKELHGSNQKDPRDVTVKKDGDYLFLEIKCKCDAGYLLLFSNTECFYRLSEL